MTIESNLSYEREIKRTNSIKNSAIRLLFPRSFLPRTYMHTFTYGIHMCETFRRAPVPCVWSCVYLRVRMWIISCMCVRLLLSLLFPLSALALTRVPKKAGERKAERKRSPLNKVLTSLPTKRNSAPSIPQHLSGSSPPLFVSKDVP